MAQQSVEQLDDSTRLVRDWASAGDIQFVATHFGERIDFSGRSSAPGAKTQAWALNPADGALLQVTDFEDGIANMKVSPTGE